MTYSDTTFDLTTRSGFTFHIRPVKRNDEAALAKFFTRVTPEDKRFRFLTALRDVGHERLTALVDVDHDKTENFLAFDPANNDIVATGMLACDADMTKGEVAIAVHSDYKNRGISWELLGHVARYAKSRGVKTIESLENREHHAAISLEREMGFVATNYPGDATLTLVRKDLN